MKKLFALILALVMVLTSLSACGKKDDTSTADTYLSMAQELLDKKDFDSALDILNKGFSVTNDPRISEKMIEVYAQRDNANATQPTANDSAGTTPDTTEPPATNPPATNPPATTPPATQPPHTHSYTTKVTAATCTAQGYTTYTCSCGDTYKDSYTNPSHSYSDYVCSKCGVIDKTHACEYLESYLKKKDSFAATSNDDSVLFMLKYRTDYGRVVLYTATLDDAGHVSSATELVIYEGWCQTVYGDNKLQGEVDKSRFTLGSGLSCSDYQGDASSKNEVIVYTQLACYQGLTWLEQCLQENNIGITLADLGFTSFE